MSTVSVLMPVHNGAPFVAAAMKSIMSQTFQDFDMVVVNDGSTDATGEILDDFAQRDSRVRVLHLSPNRGIVGALNIGLDACSGRYVARMDGDDIAHPDRLALQIAFLDTHPGHVACGCDLFFFGARHWYARYPRTDLECKSLLALYPCLPHNGVTLRRQALERVRYREDHRLAEDYRMWLDLAPLGKFANLPRPLLRYRIHPGQSISAARDAQRRVHGRIAAESLASLGIANFGAEDVCRFLWPEFGPGGLGRREYLHHARTMAAALWNINDGQCRWLRARLLRVTLRNLVLPS